MKRGDHIIFDHHNLPHLNIIEKANGHFCAYVNGLISYTQEIAGRVEQYWCPIKHARKVTTLHRRYVKYLEYGDGAGYREQVEQERRDFQDLTEKRQEV